MTINCEFSLSYPLLKVKLKVSSSKNNVCRKWYHKLEKIIALCIWVCNGLEEGNIVWITTNDTQKWQPWHVQLVMMSPITIIILRWLIFCYLGSNVTSLYIQAIKSHAAVLFSILQIIIKEGREDQTLLYRVLNVCRESHACNVNNRCTSL